MNPELERRLRSFGAAVDASAEAADAARRAAAGPRAAGDLVDVSDLDPVPPGRRPTSAYRIFAAAAAVVAVAIGGVVLFGRAVTEPDIATSQVSPSAEPAVVGTSESAVTSSPGLPAVGTEPTTSTATSSTSTTAPPATAPPTNPPVCPDYRYNESLPLRLCDRGEGVQLVQERLRATAAPSLAVDGLFGPATRDAVRNFQQDHALEVDGLVGPATWGALFPGGPTTTSAATTAG